MNNKKTRLKSRIIDYFSRPWDDNNLEGQVQNPNKPPSVSLFLLKLRTAFSKTCEKSRVAHFIDYLYYGFLSCPLSVIAVFMAVFAISSFALSFLLFSSKAYYFTDTSTLYCIFVFAISILFMPVKKDVAFLLSQSRLLSEFEFSYDKMVLSTSKKSFNFYNSYSTAFFLGILSGILSVIISPAKAMWFVLAILLCILIINRPECGILLSFFFLPFIDSALLNLLIVYTSISLVYKYFRGKRHVSLGTDEVLLSLCVLIFLLSGLFNISKAAAYKDMLGLIVAVLAFVAVKNLIKSISLFNNSVRLISESSFVVSIFSLLIYITQLLLNVSFITRLYETESFNVLYTFFSNHSFIPVFITCTMPLNFALCLGIDKKSKRFKYLFMLIIQLMCIMIYASPTLILAATFSCMIVLAFTKAKRALLLPFAPLAAILLHKISTLLPNSRIVFAQKAGFEFSGEIASKIIKDHSVFGIGLGTDSLTVAASPHATVSFNPHLHPQTTLIDSIIRFGIPCFIFILAVILFFIIKNIRIALSLKNINKLCDSSAAGLIACCASIVILSTDIFFTSNTVAVFFAIICALCGCMEKCIKSDYIDNSRIRF